MPTSKNRNGDGSHPDMPIFSLSEAMGRGAKYDKGRHPHDYLFDNIKNGGKGKTKDPLASKAGMDVKTKINWGGSGSAKKAKK